MTPERIALHREWFRTCDDATRIRGLECLDEIERLKAVIKVDDERLITAAEKAGVLYGGCDTPDALVDKVLDQAEQIRRLREALRANHNHNHRWPGRNTSNLPSVIL